MVIDRVFTDQKGLKKHKNYFVVVHFVEVICKLVSFINFIESVLISYRE